MKQLISPLKRREIIDALRRGTVPGSSLDTSCVGLESFVNALDAELERAEQGGAVFKSVRGEYGCGKTFFTRWLQDQEHLTRVSQKV